MNERLLHVLQRPRQDVDAPGHPEASFELALGRALNTARSIPTYFPATTATMSGAPGVPKWKKRFSVFTAPAFCR